MRIISGTYKGRRFQPPKKFPSRPTTDMAKEGLFNILENRMYWEDVDVLDLFAGTGSVSLEFVSRGAQKVISVDSHPISIKHLNKLHAAFNDDSWTVVRKDVRKFLSDAPDTFDLIFADPPFGLSFLPDLPEMIFSSTMLNTDGLFILEHDKSNDFENHPRFQEVRNYGGVFFSFFR